MTVSYVPENVSETERLLVFVSDHVQDEDEDSDTDESGTMDSCEKCVADDRRLSIAFWSLFRADLNHLQKTQIWTSFKEELLETREWLDSEVDLVRLWCSLTEPSFGVILYLSSVLFTIVIGIVYCIT